MNEAALIEKYRPLVRWIARDFFLPGADRDDVEQEAMVGLLRGIRDYKPERGTPLRTWLGFCIQRQLVTAVKTANRHKHRALNEAVREGGVATEDGELSLLDALPSPGSDPAEIVVAREEAFALLHVVRDALSPLERRALLGVANGLAYAEIGPHKIVDNALQRARAKLADPFEELRAA